MERIKTIERERKRAKAYNRLNEENVTYNRVYDAYKNVVVNIDFQNIYVYPTAIYSSSRLNDFYTVELNFIFNTNSIEYESILFLPPFFIQ